jgi:hypothetical protein
VLQLASNNGTTAVTIDTSQNVGIGTTSPVSYFSSARNLVVGTTSGNNGITILGGSAATAVLAFGYATGTAAGDGSNRAKIYYDGPSDTLRMSAGGSLMSASQFVLDASGNLLVGTTTRSADLVTFASAGATANQLGLRSTDDVSGNTFVIFRNSASTAIGSIARVTTTNAVAYNTTSDERLKSNITDASPILNKLMAVKVRQFDWTEGNLHQDYGFIAQELEPILSGVVTKGKTEEDTWQLDYSRLTPHLVKAIQELKAINDQQAETINALTARVVALESKVGV